MQFSPEINQKQMGDDFGGIGEQQQPQIIITSIQQSTYINCKYSAQEKRADDRIEGMTCKFHIDRPDIVSLSFVHSFVRLSVSVRVCVFSLFFSRFFWWEIFFLK